MTNRYTNLHRSSLSTSPKEYEAQLILQEYSEIQQRHHLTINDNYHYDRSDNDKITTWNVPQNTLPKQQPTKPLYNRSKPKQHALYKKRIFLKDVSCKVQTHDKTLCRQQQLQAHLVAKTPRKCIANQIASERPRCAISMLNPSFNQQQCSESKTKHKSSFYFSGSLFKKVYLSKQKDSHEKGDFLCKKAKMDMAKVSRTENNSNFSTIMEHNPRVSSLPNEQKQQKACSALNFNLCLLTQGQQEKSREDVMPKAVRHISLKTNRALKSKKLFTSTRSNPTQISSELINSAFEFKLLHCLLTRQKLQ